MEICEGKAKRQVDVTMAMGVRAGVMRADLGARIWETIGKPTMLYGAEVLEVEDWKGADRIAYKVGKQILGLRGNVACVAVRGELGWWKMAAYAQERRLVYAHKLLTSKEGSIIRKVAEEAIGRVARGGESWWKWTFQLLEYYGLDSDPEEIRKISRTGWKKTVKEGIMKKEEKGWREEMKLKAKLRTLVMVKQALKAEEYLKWPTNQVKGRMILTRLRVGTNCLMIEQQRRCNPGVLADDRICPLCKKEAETESHFLSRCAAYNDLRYKSKIILALCSQDGKECVPYSSKKMLSPETKEMAQEVFRFCKQAMKRRNEYLRKEEEEKKEAERKQREDERREKQKIDAERKAIEKEITRIKRKEKAKEREKLKKLRRRRSKW
jgi:hypothetical protein